MLPISESKGGEAPGDAVQHRPRATSLLAKSEADKGVGQNEVLLSAPMSDLGDSLGRPYQRVSLEDIDVLEATPLVPPDTGPRAAYESGRDPGYLLGPGKPFALNQIGLLVPPIVQLPGPVLGKEWDPLVPNHLDVPARVTTVLALEVGQGQRGRVPEDFVSPSADAPIGTGIEGARLRPLLPPNCLHFRHPPSRRPNATDNCNTGAGRFAQLDQ